MGEAAPGDPHRFTDNPLPRQDLLWAPGHPHGHHCCSRMNSWLLRPGEHVQRDRGAS